MSARGFTLLELLVVVTVLGVVAMVVIPRVASHGDGQKLTLAAAELANALRFARSEALRTGAECRVEIDPAVETFRVVDAGGTTLFHPVSKQPFVTDLGALPMAGGVDIVSVGGSAGLVRVNFCARGEPVDGAGSPLAADVAARLALAGAQVDVVTGRKTGRVRVQ